ncbi:type II toxin-antitoxin system HipA family toxin [Caballeronia sp. LZ035]|uniref:type II toxin-antitoxin system HipA family toxin n=1 Tax=Caballeronia sp. LZ035 TaxID=3038568 RepID=UPI00285F6996|nr:type II toxin-antitoxin system HipA family toxin [Caballeronia sp. LZ035]MDR5757566.1 type II toxin-antitoxin system HipA family toxin [Caballeronia sp. LZ035]
MTKKKERAEYEVHLQTPELDVSQRVGTLFPHEAITALAASFEYDTTWLASGAAFMLDPRLALFAGEQHPHNKAPAFGIFMDSSPDRWGRVLMERREAAAASKQDRKMRKLREIDYLLGVYDHTRMGGLRFRSSTGPFLDDSNNAAPPVSSLKELAYISRRVEEPGVENLPEYEQWLAMLVAPGSSLGGARPKANFTDDDQRLWIAKFPSREDRYDVGAWEFLMHVLAAAAGIILPEARLEKLSERYRTFCAQRFDRSPRGRRMYASAMTLLERQDGDAGASYLDLVQFISDTGAQGHINEDLEQLFRRLLFNVIVGNRDDHLRNHGFIREPSGWRLSPAFDVNPNPYKADHALTLDGLNATPDVNAVMATAALYRLTDQRAEVVRKQVESAVAGWREEARRLSIPSFEVKQMENVIQI